jgi:hypothetical protein
MPELFGGFLKGSRISCGVTEWILAHPIGPQITILEIAQPDLSWLADTAVQALRPDDLKDGTLNMPVGLCLCPQF